jgi:uncharacterized protein YegJ (DUF2314 family)
MTLLRRAMPSVLALSLACSGAKPAANVAKPAVSIAETTVSVPAEDAEMNAAMQQARGQVTDFVERLQKPRAADRNFSVKMPIWDGGQVEHFWIADLRHDSGVFRGTLGNDPELIRGHRFGELVSVPMKDISDWMYVDRDRLVGGFTIRVLRNRMAPIERAAMDKQLDFKIE